MATAFDYTNIALLTLLSYAREFIGENLTLEELADSIESDASEFFANNDADDQDQTLTTFASEAIVGMLRELAKNGYTYDDLLNGVTNILPEEALDGLSDESDEDEEEESEDDEEELDDEDDEEEEEDEDDDSEEDDDDLEEEEDEDEEEEEDDEDDDDLEEEEDDDLDEEEEDGY